MDMWESDSHIALRDYLTDFIVYHSHIHLHCHLYLLQQSDFDMFTISLRMDSTAIKESMNFSWVAEVQAYTLLASDLVNVNQHFVVCCVSWLFVECVHLWREVLASYEHCVLQTFFSPHLFQLIVCILILSCFCQQFNSLNQVSYS